jgi:uncharacterized protein YdeI (YjbR/CyaY-like superfamily)
MPRPDAEQVHPETVEEWRAWLEANHDRPNGVWLVQWKSSTGRPRLTYEESIVEALAVGWVDSTAGTIDAERSRLWFSPRRRGSGWARPNKVRIARLEAEGRLRPAGRQVVEQAMADGSWTLLDSVEDLLVPDDLAAAFDGSPGARQAWDAFPRSVRHAALTWIVQAKRSETRARRVKEVASAAARGERPRAGQRTPGQPPTG